MKKIICALLGLFISVSAFADGKIAVIGSDGVSVMETSSTIFIPRLYIEKIAEYDPKSKWWRIGANKVIGVLTGTEVSEPISKEAADAMLAKYDELAATTKKTDNIGSLIEGNKELSVKDVYEICFAGGIENKEECYDRVIAPIFSALDSIFFRNVCENPGNGGIKHCVDGTFTTEYRIPGTGTKTTVDLPILPEISLYDGREKVVSSNPYAQDVEVGKNLAFGFAIEYAKLHGDSVLCDSRVHNNWINCTTPDNDTFYTFKFADTTKDNEEKHSNSSIEKGICALFDTEYHGLPASHGYVYCGMNCSKGTYPNKVIPKFGVDIVDEYWVDKEKECRLNNRENYVHSHEIKTYPGYEAMSYAFADVQAVYDFYLRQILEKYVKLQGIKFNSFECDYSPKDFAISDPAHGAVVQDNVIRCRIDEVPVDFIFDDLFETKEYALKAGMAGIQCLTLTNSYGSTYKFDGKHCIGPNEEKCDWMREKKGIKTHYDPETKLCILDDAEYQRNVVKWNTIILGTGAAVGLTVITGGAGAHAAVAIFGEILITAGSVLAWDTWEEFMETRPTERVRDIVSESLKCEVPVADHINSGTECPISLDKCTSAQKRCSEDVLKKYFATATTVMNQVNDDQVDYLNATFGTLACCVEPEKLQTLLEESVPLWQDRVLNYVTVAFGVVLVFASTAVVAGLSKLPRISNLLIGSRRVIKVEENLFMNIKGSSNKIRVNRINVKKLSDEEKGALVNKLKDDGVEYIDASDVKHGKYFVAKKDIASSGEYIYYSSDVTVTGTFGLPEVSVVGEHTAIQKILNKVYIDKETFIKNMNNVKATGNSFHISRYNLSDNEWTLLQEYVQGEGLDISKTTTWYYSIIKPKVAPVKPVVKPKPVVSPEHTANGIKFGKWTFKSSTDDGLGIKYYERVFDDSSAAENLANNLEADFGYQYIAVFKRDDRYVVAVFENEDNWNSARGVLGSRNILGNYNFGNTPLRLRVYNDSFSEAEINKLLEDIINKSLVNGNVDKTRVIPLLKNAGFYSETKAIKFANDLAEGAAKRVLGMDATVDAKIVDRLRRYKTLTQEEKLDLASDLHNVITSELRDHVGNTEIGYTFKKSSSFCGGGGTAEDGFNFAYYIDEDDLKEFVGTIFHENTHAYQRLGKTTLPKSVEEFNRKYYADPKGYPDLYYDNVIELEAFKVEAQATSLFLMKLGL